MNTKVLDYKDTLYVAVKNVAMYQLSILYQKETYVEAIEYFEREFGLHAVDIVYDYDKDTFYITVTHKLNLNFTEFRVEEDHDIAIYPCEYHGDCALKVEIPNY